MVPPPPLYAFIYYDCSFQWCGVNAISPSTCPPFSQCLMNASVKQQYTSLQKATHTCEFDYLTVHKMCRWTVACKAECTFRSRFLWYGDVTIACAGLQTLDVCSALGAFEQEGIYIVLYLLWYGDSVFPVSSEEPSHVIASYDLQGYHLIASEDLF
jgi:hypothetical protein